jgi:hypothetical protein
MTVDEFRRLLFAPELIVLDVADAALDALERALILEHPLVQDPDCDDDPPVRRSARAVLRPTARLRRALRAYRRVVAHILREQTTSEDPL